MGEFSQKMHQKIGEEVLKNNINILLTVGTEAKTIAETVKSKAENIQVYSFNNNIDASKLLKELMQQDDVILIKASNGMHFEQIVESIK